MNIKKRLEKLEAAAKAQSTKHIITEIILVPFGATSGIARWCYGTKVFVSVSSEELAGVCTEHQLPETKLD